MTIPPFTFEGILPPFLGSSPVNPQLLSPYVTTAADVVSRFSTTGERKTILSGWLGYRKELRDIGLTEGFQWLAGSFVEDKPPKDLDMMVFIARPAAYSTDAAFNRLVAPYSNLFDPLHTKTTCGLDVYAVDLGVDQSFLVDFVRYFLQLFCHRRNSYSWKGMLTVRQEDLGDEASLLGMLTSTPSGGQP